MENGRRGVTAFQYVEVPLRSPFGVRNVKFYWNGLPLTGGGNTYLNLLDFGALKQHGDYQGRAAAFCSAGTGGVMLLQSLDHPGELQGSVTGGSYGLFRAQAGGQVIQQNNFQMNLGVAINRRWMVIASKPNEPVDAESQFGRIRYPQDNFSRKPYFLQDLLSNTKYGVLPPNTMQTLVRPRCPCPLAPGAAAQQAAILPIKPPVGGLMSEQNLGASWTSPRHV